MSTPPKWVMMPRRLLTLTGVNWAGRGGRDWRETYSALMSRKILSHPYVFKLKCKVFVYVLFVFLVPFGHLWLCQPWPVTGVLSEKNEGSLGQEITVGLRVFQLSSRHPAMAVPDGCLFVYGVCLVVRKWSHGVWKKNEVLLLKLSVLLYKFVKLHKIF